MSVATGIASVAAVSRGVDPDRTGTLPLARRMLNQLSYNPKENRTGLEPATNHHAEVRTTWVKALPVELTVFVLWDGIEPPTSGM